jgi:hypothetical protein
VHAFEALRVYNKYNCTLIVQDFEFVSGLCLIGEKGTGSDRGSLTRCGPAAAGRAGPFDRKEQSFFPRHFGPSGRMCLDLKLTGVLAASGCSSVLFGANE